MVSVRRPRRGVERFCDLEPPATSTSSSVQGGDISLSDHRKPPQSYDQGIDADPNCTRLINADLNKGEFRLHPQLTRASMLLGLGGLIMLIPTLNAVWVASRFLQDYPPDAIAQLGRAVYWGGYAVGLFILASVVELIGVSSPQRHVRTSVNCSSRAMGSQHLSHRRLDWDLPHSA